MRITKDIAQDVAIKLLAKKYASIKQFKLQLAEKIKPAYDKTIPEDVLKTASKYPDYFDINNYVRLNGNGWNYVNINMEGLKVVSKRSISPLFEPQGKFADVIKKLHNELADKESEVKQLKTEIENTLYSLRTYAKISEIFPEAVPFLPKHENTQLVVNVQGLRDRLK